MSHFVEWNKLRDFFLCALRYAGLLLRLGRQKNQRRKIEQARPALAERAGNLRDIELRKRKWSVDGFIIVNRVLQSASELLEHRRRIRHECRTEIISSVNVPGQCAGRQTSGGVL